MSERGVARPGPRPRGRPLRPHALPARLSKLLLRHGIRFDGGAAWTQRHRDWLSTVTLDWPAAQATMLDAQGAIDVLAHRRDTLEREIIAMIPDSPWAVQVGRLRCLRGVDTLTAVGLCAEIGDFERFAKAEQLMNYIGLVPCENTTGQQRRLGSITKTGSRHARRLLVEAAWHYRKRPAIGKMLSDRQASQPPEAIAVAWSAQRRLHRTWTRLEARAKRRTIIAVAAARELCWVLLGDHPDRVNRTPDIAYPVGSVVAARHRAGNPRPNYEQPAPRLATPDLRQRLPTTNMVLRSQPAYISLTARRAQPAGPPPTQPTTPQHQRPCEKSTTPT